MAQVVIAIYVKLSNNTRHTFAHIIEVSWLLINRKKKKNVNHFFFTSISIFLSIVVELKQVWIRNTMQFTRYMYIPPRKLEHSCLIYGQVDIPDGELITTSITALDNPETVYGIPRQHYKKMLECSGMECFKKRHFMLFSSCKDSYTDRDYTMARSKANLHVSKCHPHICYPAIYQVQIDPLDASKYKICCRYCFTEYNSMKAYKSECGYGFMNED